MDSSNQINSSLQVTLATSLVMDDVIAHTTEEYLDEIDPLLTSKPAPSPSQIKTDLLKRTNIKFQLANANVKEAKNKITLLKNLTPSQIARILIRLHHAVRISPSQKNTDPDYDLVAIYCDSGVNEGIYLTSENSVRAAMRQYNGEITQLGAKEVLGILQDVAPQVYRCADRDLIPVNNGLFDYQDKKLLPFTPEVVFLSKARVNFNKDAQSPVIVHPEDGTSWEVEEWMNELSDDPEIVELLWQILGAIVRPSVRWNKSAWFYSEKGNNGKGTLCELMRNLVGPSSYASIPLVDFGKDFMLEPLTRASAIIVDENDVGTFIDRSANLKAVVTNDVISINRKYKTPINYQFWGFMVQCLNEYPQIKDKSESFYRRQIFVKFDKSFTGRERRYIKGDYLSRTEVLEYVLKRVLLDMPSYYELSEPEAVQIALDDFKEYNDSMRAFWSEFEDEFTWDLLPFTFLYDLYKAWFEKTNPGGYPIKYRRFLQELTTLIENSDIWYCEDKTKKIRTAKKMDNPEYLIHTYDLVDWKQQGYSGANIKRMCTPTTAVSYRGLERRITASAPSQSQGSSNDD